MFAQRWWYLWHERPASNYCWRIFGAGVDGLPHFQGPLPSQSSCRTFVFQANLPLWHAFAATVAIGKHQVPFLRRSNRLHDFTTFSNQKQLHRRIPELFSGCDMNKIYSRHIVICAYTKEYTHIEQWMNYPLTYAQFHLLAKPPGAFVTRLSRGISATARFAMPIPKWTRALPSCDDVFLGGYCWWKKSG